MEQTFCEEGGANVIQSSSIHACDSLPTLDGNSRAIVSITQTWIIFELLYSAGPGFRQIWPRHIWTDLAAKDFRWILRAGSRPGSQAGGEEGKEAEEEGGDLEKERKEVLRRSVENVNKKCCVGFFYKWSFYIMCLRSCEFASYGSECKKKFFSG